MLTTCYVHTISDLLEQLVASLLAQPCYKITDGLVKTGNKQCEHILEPMSNFAQKENFVKCDWPTQIFRRKKILKLLTMIFSENFLSVEIFLWWEKAFKLVLRDRRWTDVITKIIFG